MPTKNVAIEQDRSPDWYPCLTEWLRVCKVIYNRGTNAAICFNGEKRSTGLKVLKVKSFTLVLLPVSISELTLKYGPNTSPAKDIKLYLNNTSANTLTLKVFFFLQDSRLNFEFIIFSKKGAWKASLLFVPRVHYFFTRRDFLTCRYWSSSDKGVNYRAGILVCVWCVSLGTDQLKWPPQTA